MDALSVERWWMIGVRRDAMVTQFQWPPKMEFKDLKDYIDVKVKQDEVPGNL